VCRADKRWSLIGTRHVIVAPAGNHEWNSPRYPAALHATYSNVIGVASHDGTVAAPARSIFSDYGDWVTCSAVGQQVVSMFVVTHLPPEEDPDPGKPHQYNAWAEWNGTSFASPKIAAAIASLGAPNDPVAGWQELQISPLMLGNDPDIGLMFNL
jgi:hypothetical protein